MSKNPDNFMKEKLKEKHKEPYFGYTQTDVYYNTKEKLEDSNVAIPTDDAVLKAKEWVDDINKK